MIEKGIETWQGERFSYIGVFQGKEYPVLSVTENFVQLLKEHMDGGAVWSFLYLENK